VLSFLLIISNLIQEHDLLSRHKTSQAYLDPDFGVTFHRLLIICIFIEGLCNFNRREKDGTDSIVVERLGLVFSQGFTNGSL
jgi:hypothetical protein